MNALVLAAGYGKRLRPVTDYIPKALITLQNKPLLYILLKKLERQKFTNIIINAHHLAEQVEKYIQSYSKENNSNILVTREPILMDTGGGIKNMLQKLPNDEPVLVHNVDIISTLDFNQFYQSHLNSGAAASLAVQKRDTTRPLLFDENMHLCGKKSKHDGQFNIVKSPSGTIVQWAFCGIQVIQPEIFLEYPANRFYSIDVYTKNAAKNKIIKGIDIGTNYWKDLGTSTDITEAEKEIESFQLDINSL